MNWGCRTQGLSVTLLMIVASGSTWAAIELITPSAGPALGVPFEQHEEIHDPYLPPAKPRRTSPPTIVRSRDGYVSIQVNVDANGNNILGDAANEPSIAVDPGNPYRMVIGWRQFDTVASNFRQAGYGYTNDGGQTWTFPGVIEPGVFRSDPVLDTDLEGNFYFNSLTDRDRYYLECNVFKSADGGVTWDGGTYAYGGDKQWMVIDKTDGVGRGNIYAYWTCCEAGCYSKHFTRSIDGGQSFQACSQMGGTARWGTLAVGPDGELYSIGFYSPFWFLLLRSDTAKLIDAEVSWLPCGRIRLGGGLVFGLDENPNPDGLLGQAWVATDRTDGPMRGRVYVLASVSNWPDPADVMFMHSTDEWYHWSDPIRINDDVPNSGAFQWFGTLSVAPNGRIDVIWNDTRNDPNGYDSELMYSFSTDGGENFSPNVAVSPPFDPHLGWPNQRKIGDYYTMVSDNTGADVAYAATFNGEQDVYYLRLGQPRDACRGRIELDQSRYACTDLVRVLVTDCDLNTSNDVLDLTQATVSSDSTPEGVVVLLTETSPMSARFAGVVQLSPDFDPNSLRVAEADTLTAHYLDATAGGGLTDVERLASASFDCTPPTFQLVDVTDVDVQSAVIHVAADEPVQVMIDYGAACDVLAEQATSAEFDLAADIALAPLVDDTFYHYVVSAVDEVGNRTVGPDCHSLQTPPQPNYFTELFDDADNDLDYLSITFTPDSSPNGYSACIAPITALPFAAGAGTPLPAANDFYTIVDLADGAQFPFFDGSYSRVYIGGNGYVTFDSGDSSAAESVSSHFQYPRIAALFDDLDLSAGGTAEYSQLADRLVATFIDVPERDLGGANTFQIEMGFDGAIAIHYLGIDALDGLVGLSPGGFAEPSTTNDLSALLPCALRGDVNCDGHVDFADIDPFVLILLDPAAFADRHPTCNRAAADTNVDGLINFSDIDSFVALLTGG